MGMSYAARRNKLTVKTLDRISLNYKKAAQQGRLREKSPDPYNEDYTSREEIYLKLLQENSTNPGLDVKEVFHGAPSFFKKKIGLKDTYVPKETSERPPLESKSSPSLFRLRNCSGCSSSTDLHKSDTGDGKWMIHKRESPYEALASQRTRRGESREEEHKCSRNWGFPGMSDSRPPPAPKKPEWKSVWNKPSVSNLHQLPPSTTSATGNMKAAVSYDPRTSQPLPNL